MSTIASATLSDHAIMDGCILAMVLDEDAAERGLSEFGERIAARMLGAALFDRSGTAAVSMRERLGSLGHLIDGVLAHSRVNQLLQCHRGRQASSEMDKEMSITLHGLKTDLALGQMSMTRGSRQAAIDAFAAMILIDVLSASPEDRVHEHVLDLSERLPRRLDHLAKRLQAETDLTAFFDAI